MYIYIYIYIYIYNIERERQRERERKRERKELDKACFVHDAAYSDGKDLAKRTMSDRILKDTAYEIAKNRKYDVYHKALASMVYKVIDKKTGVAVSVNEHLAEELFKPVVKTFIQSLYDI